MKNKIVVITGSTSGIGRQTALLFASLGAKVVITGRRANVIAEVVEKCQILSPNGYKPLGIVADLTCDEDVKKMVKITIDTHDVINVLVNSAGCGTFTAIDNPNLMEIYRWITDIDVRAPLFLCHLFAPYLEKTKGCIVNVSSLCGLKPYENLTVYCMAKAALDMMTKCLTIELGRKGIRVNNVNPAYVKTNFQRRMGLSEEDNLALRAEEASKYPLGRVGEPIDVAEAIAFLASGDASWISGALLNLDGGGQFT